MFLQNLPTLSFLTFFFGFGFDSTCHVDDPLGSELILKIEAMPIPRLDPASRGDKAAVAEYQARLRDILSKRSLLILDLFNTNPDHPRLPDLMNERWKNYGLPKPAKLIEYDDVLKRTKNSTLRGHALYWRAFEKCIQASRDVGQFPILSDSVEEFLAHDHADPRGATLLNSLALVMESVPETRAKIERRILFEYPESNYSKMILGKIRKTDFLGKEFELEFDDAINGKHVSIKDFRGKIVVIDFWATWCRPCIEGMPRLMKIYEYYHPKGIEIIGISLDYPEKVQGLSRLKNFVDQNKIPWPQYYQGNGWESEFSRSWGINMVPTMFVIDQNGKVYSINAQTDPESVIRELLPKN